MVLRRPIAAALGVALLLVVAGVAGPAGSAAAQEQGDSEGTTISVSATGTVEAEPNQALVGVAVVERADSANAVREAVAANVSTLREALRNASVPDDAVRTTSFFIDREVEFRNGTEVVTGYVGVHAFEVRLDDIDRAGEIIDVAVANGASRVEGVTFTLSDDRQRELRTQALEQAMDAARADADAVAETANLTVTRIDAISVGSDGFVPFFAEAREQAADAATTIEPGPVTVRASVTVTYNATAG